MRRAVWCGAARLGLAILAIGGLVGASAAAEDPEAFTQRMLQGFRAELADMTIESKGPLVLEIAPQTGQPLRINLQRVWEFCRTNARECVQVSGDYTRRTAGMLRERRAPIEPAMIRLALGTESYVEQLHKTFPEPAQQPLASPLAGDLWFLGVADFPNSTRVMNQGDLKALGLTLEDLIAAGKRNLAGALEPLAKPEAMIGSDLVGILEGESYESSRILLHDTWAQLAALLGGALIVAVPDPQIVLYADSRREGAVAAMREAVRRSLELSPRKLSGTILQWTPQGWQPLSP
jgi:hypothetical protein